MTFRAIAVEHLTAVLPRDQPIPVLQWISIADLMVDEDYQRPLLPANWKAIGQIAEAFSWQRFAPVLVAPLEGGRFGIVDGQHRVHAAALCGVAQVPAMIVPMSRREQAGAFLGINAQVVRVSAHQLYRAALAADEPWAVDLDAAIKAAGCQMMMSNPSGNNRQARCIYAPVWPRKVMETGHREALTLALAAMRAFDVRGKAALWTDYILRPWVAGVILAMHVAGPLPAEVLVATLQAREPFKGLQDAQCDLLPGSAMAKASRAFAALILAQRQAMAG